MSWLGRLGDVFHRDNAEEAEARKEYLEAKAQLGIRAHGRVWEYFHPRQAENEFWIAKDAREMREAERIDDANRDYYDWAHDEGHTGNPPESELRDEKIARLSELFPEVSALEQQQEDFYAEAYDRGPGMAYPEYEGPGFTEPPLNWAGDHDPEWTFTGWAEERGYSREWIEEVNDMYPQDPREVEYARQREEREAAEAREYDRETRGWSGREWEELPDPALPPPIRYTAVREVRDDPEANEAAPRGELTFVPDPRLSAPGRSAEHARAIDEGRWLPTEYDLGITNQPQDEMGQPREVRGEPDPYNPLYFPSYSYWPDPEAGQ